MNKRRFFLISVAIFSCVAIFYWTTHGIEYLSLLKVAHRNQNYEDANARFSESGNVEQRLKERKRRMNRVCTKFGYNRNLPADVVYKKNKLLSRTLIYSDKSKILLCSIPKVASRNQATFIGMHEGFGDRAINEPLVIAQKYLSLQNLKRIEDATARINEYTKIVIAREPFSRLLSAYRNKIETGGSAGPFFKRKYDDIQRRKQDKNGAVSFTDFVEYLVNNQDKPSIDQHWNYYEKLCSPCEIDYAYVVHLNTLEEDINYITNKIGMTNYTFPPSFDTFTDFEKVKRYYSKLPSTLTEKLYHKYKRDFDLFGFPRLRL